VRQVVFQTHRGNVPQRFHHFAIHEDPWKLVHPSGFGKERFEGEPKLELFDLSKDPRQQNDVAADYPDVFDRLKTRYENWFRDVSSTRPDNYAPPRILIGTENERCSVLTRQDWRHLQGRPWGADSNGFWALEAPEAGEYLVEVVFDSGHPAGKATITAGSRKQQLEIPVDQRRGHTATMQIPAGKIELAVDVVFDGKTQGPHQVILTRQ